MTPNKTTEQPIPSDFMVWAEKHIKETFPFVPIPNKAGEERVTPVGHSPFGYNKYRKEKGKLMKMAIDSYCHLHSLPSSPVGEAEAKWVKASERLPNDSITKVCRIKYMSPGYSYRELIVKDGRTSMGNESSWLIADIPMVILRNMDWLDESPNPSRAGEISPVLPRWVKERIDQMLSKSKKEWATSDKNDQYTSGYDDALLELLKSIEEAPPTPAPEVKEERMDRFRELCNEADQCISNIKEAMPGAKREMKALREKEPAPEPVKDTLVEQPFEKQVMKLIKQCVSVIHYEGEPESLARKIRNLYSKTAPILTIIRWASDNHVQRKGKYWGKDYSNIAYTNDTIVEEFLKTTIE